MMATDFAAAGEAPLVRLAPDLFDQNDPASLGLAVLPAEHVLLYKAGARTMKYSHHPHLGVFKNALYAMWSSGPKDEDSPGQHVVYARSQDGRSWSTPEILAPDPDGPQGPLRRTAGGWWVAGDQLIAYDTLFAGVKPRPGFKWSEAMRLEARVSSDGRHWSAPRKVIDNFMINEAPRPFPSGRLLMTGEDASGTPRLLISDCGDGLRGWRDTALPRPALARLPNEPTWFTPSAGRPRMLFRDDNRSGCLYASRLNDAETSWSMPLPTDFPDAQSKARAGNLPGGEAYVISNPSPNVGRAILTIALSADGVLFDRAFVLRGEPVHPAFSDPSKSDGYQYPNSLVWRGWLYVIYSVNKEDVMVSRVRLGRLAHKSGS